MRFNLCLLTLLTPLAFGAIATTSSSDAIAAERTRTQLKLKHDGSGTAHIISTFGLVVDGNADVNEVALVVSEVQRANDPTAEAIQVDQPFVWEDPATGEKTYSAGLAFGVDTVDQTYRVTSTWYDASMGILGQSEDEVIVEGQRGPKITVTVLNDANADGDVVLVKGDLAQVSFSVECDCPWLTTYCNAQKAQTSSKDKIQLLNPDGTVEDQVKRGKNPAGSALLKAKKVASHTLFVGYLSRASGSIVATSATRIRVVADPTTGVLLGEVADLKAQVAQLTTDLGDANDAIALNTAKNGDNFQLIDELTSESVLLGDVAARNTAASGANTTAIAALDERITSNGGAIALNTAKNGDNFQLIDELTHESALLGDVAARNTAASGANTTAIAALDERITNHDGAIALNTAKDDNIFELIDELTVESVLLGDIAASIATDSGANTTAIAELSELNAASGARLLSVEEAASSNAAGIEANKEGVLAAAATNFGGDQPAELIFPFDPNFSMTVSPGQVVNEDGSSFSSNLYLSELALEVAGTADAPVVRMAIFGVVFGLNNTKKDPIETDALVLPNITGAPAGTVVALETLHATTGDFIGGGTMIVSDSGMFLVNEGSVSITIN